jgi:hypothetical protein
MNWVAADLPARFRHTHSHRELSEMQAALETFRSSCPD